MELREIVHRYAEGLSYIDAHTTHISSNGKTGATYLPGLLSLGEPVAMRELDQWWGHAHPDDFGNASDHAVQVRYPQSTITCDQILTTVGAKFTPEWCIEAKRLQLIGDNGGQNDFGTGKALSPYLKDRSLMHDIDKLRAHPFGDRLAVIAYGFNYTPSTLQNARQLHPEHSSRLDKIQDVVLKNGGTLALKPVADFANDLFRVQRLTATDYEYEIFNAWRHPCGGQGVVFGWEILKHGVLGHTPSWSE